MRISDCSSDLGASELCQTVRLRARISAGVDRVRPGEAVQVQVPFADRANAWSLPLAAVARQGEQAYVFVRTAQGFDARKVNVVASAGQSVSVLGPLKSADQVAVSRVIALKAAWRSEKPTSELQSLMRITYAVFCLK